jgi:hypothetical protein
MLNTKRTTKICLCIAIISGITFSCQKKVEEKIVPVTEYITVTPTVPGFRASFDYSKLTATTPYDSLFLDQSGNKTVDLTDGNNLLNMLGEINTYGGKANGVNNDQLDSTKFKNMFFNSGTVFSNALLNASSLDLANFVAKSTSNSTKERAYFVKLFAGIDIASDSVLTDAAKNKAGKIKNPTNANAYLLDSNGIEPIQLIQKGLIGAFEYDYIGNILFSDTKLNADNHHLVPSKNYTELEHNWDLAYAILTSNKVYGSLATSSTSGERFLGSYIWEDGRSGNPSILDDYKKIQPAFLKGRAAIVNNDIAEAKKQANIIKTLMEKTIAKAAIRYLERWRDRNGTTPATAHHQISEGLGFIYSMRFCKLNGGDELFSDEILNTLVYSKANGIWDQTTSEEINTVIAKIKTKFGL